MQKGLYLVKPSKSFVVVKKAGRGLYTRFVTASIKSSKENTLPIELRYLGALLIPYPVLMWGKDDD